MIPARRRMDIYYPSRSFDRLLFHFVSSFALNLFS
jgi:hypothetical protein